jgi:hypothetical protein
MGMGNVDLVLYQRAAPSDRLRVWVGAFGELQAPNLAWQLDGAARAPQALRPISSVRSDDMLPPAGVPRAFTCVYEFDGLQPDTRHTITIETGGGRKDWSLRTLPATIPAVLDQWFNVLLVSCFYQPEDVTGVVGTIVSELKAAAQPHLTLLMGDQVYLDLPSHFIFPTDRVGLADKFETDYRRNWTGSVGYAKVLAAAPSLHIADDHEYWNNFPNVTPVVANTWTASGREAWGRAAQAMYLGFQHSYADQLGNATTLDIAPLSFFMLDGRTNRDSDRRFIMAPAELAQLDAWVQHVIDQRLFGVFVSGQTLFIDPASLLVGKTADYEMPNYGDYRAIVRALTRLADAGRPALCVTGDVHWGRMIEARDQFSGRTAFREIITSPASLVAMIGADQITSLGSRIGGWFGATPDPWPRHPSPRRPPAFFASAVNANRFACIDPPTHMQRGDQVALLSFQQSGGGLDMRISYYPLSLNPDLRRPTILGPFRLRNI